MFYVHQVGKGYEINCFRCSTSDFEYGTYREAFVCAQRLRGITLEDSVLDKWFPASCEQTKLE